ncbi:MAG TPA: MiaB/RimO family radical SAM methylthiotransferase [Phycisphaerales bacterium]|nr:MiaB/RimO family radical SAM methylthiotransferase [Phycisphaerales bacterium]
MASPAVYLETFGCQMNELDSELVTGSLRALGYRFTPDAEAADVVLYNTCSVRELAEQKVWSRLGEMAQRKARQPGLVVGVLGCMAEREGPALMKRMPVVDVMVGPGELDKLPGLLDNAVRTRASLAQEIEPAPADDPHPDTRGLVSARQAALAGNTSRRSATLAAAADTLEMLDLSRAVSAETLGPSRSAYVRITRGCNKFCTYCVVPFTRGAEVHRPPRHIVDECKRLADAGVIEVTLLGQTVNHYRFEHGAAVTLNGVVQPQKGRVYKRGESQTDAYAGVNVTTFADLLRMIHEEVPAVRRLRFVTSYPRDFGDDVLSVMRDSPRICRYLHVPAQSGSDRVLGLMNRGYTVAEYTEFLDRARALLHQPEIGRPLTLAGDIIVGFPTETEEDFQATRSLLERARYKNCFIFKYSPRPGTVAIDRFVDDVPDDVKRRRNNELLALQNRVSDEVGREFVGQTLEVFVQGVSRRTAKAQARAAKAPKGTVGLTVAGRSLGDGGDDCQGACSTGATHVALEPVSEAGPVQMTARTDGDLIVLFDAPGGTGETPDDLIGTIRRVRVEASRPLALHGSLL